MKAKRKKPDLGLLACADCGEECVRNGPTQRYCRPCSTKRDIARKGLYQNEKGKQAFDEKRAKWLVHGKAISREERLSLISSLPQQPNLLWHTRVAVPFSWAGSKNQLFATTRTGHTFLREEGRYYRSLLTQKIRETVDVENVRQNKLWVDIYVQKPNHKGDAANFLDMVCDAIKDAIPLDDRWYSIRSIDWQICKDEPMLYVGLGQDSRLDVQACSSCGRLMEYHFFQKNRATPNGVTRVCRECQSVKLADKRLQRRQPATIEDGIFG